MNKKIGSSLKTIGLFGLSVLVLIFISFFYYENKEITDINKTKKFMGFERISTSVGDKTTLALIKKAKEDNKITNREFKAISRSFSEYKLENATEFKSAEIREKEFMERKAQYLKEHNGQEKPLN